jgi:pimeloyl-ACP methyl ester carboxylesterase
MSETTNTDAATVVLVHGAFADSSSWNGVVARLLAEGVTVTAPANPLRGVAADSEYIAAVLEQIEGPVIAVGHSYGGAVITNAAAKAKNVVGLVFVAAFAPDEGESLGEATAASKDAVLGSVLVPQHYPSGTGELAVEFAIGRAGFHAAFAADLPETQTAVMAATQRPISELAFSERTGDPAWRHLPSWAIIPTPDKAAGTDVLRSMAERADARITDVEGSHVIMISQPELVTNVILEAIAATDRQTAGAI